MGALAVIYVSSRLKTSWHSADTQQTGETFKIFDRFLWLWPGTQTGSGLPDQLPKSQGDLLAAFPLCLCQSLVRYLPAIQEFRHCQGSTQGEAKNLKKLSIIVVFLIFIVKGGWFRLWCTQSKLNPQYQLYTATIAPVPSLLQPFLKTTIFRLGLFRSLW